MARPVRTARDFTSETTQPTLQLRPVSLRDRQECREGRRGVRTVWCVGRPANSDAVLLQRRDRRQGLIPRRDLDQFGIGYFYSSVRNPTLELRIGETQSFLRDEGGFEAFYNVALTPWLPVTPNVQVIGPSQKQPLGHERSDPPPASRPATPRWCPGRTVGRRSLSRPCQAKVRKSMFSPLLIGDRRATRRHGRWAVHRHEMSEVR